MGEPSKKEERTPSEDEVMLYLWQRAAFLDTGDGPRDSADSLRLRLAQLDYYRFKTKESGKTTVHLDHLMKDYMHQYARVVDEKDESKGMNNYASAAHAIAAGHETDLRGRKSNMTFESVIEMPEIKALLNNQQYPEKPREPFRNPLVKTSSIQWPPQIYTTVHDQGQQSSTQVQNKQSVQPSPIDTAPSTSRRNPSSLHTSAGSTTDSSISGMNMRQDPMGSRQKMFRSDRQLQSAHSDEVFPSSKRARVMTETSMEEERGSTEFESGQRKQKAFITARDQFHINRQKKFGSGGGKSVNTTSYGTSKRSLGTRRNAGGKFVPPVKQDDSDATCTKFTEHVTSKVMSHGGSNSGGSGAGNLPPELEGNERLRNIEPKMVELIINEIMDNTAPVQWDDIAGLHYAKESIKEIVVWPMMRPDLFTGLRGPPKGILLFGPPGTGKTLIGKCIASQVEATFFSISASSLTSKWIGEGEKMVRALFAVARCYQPAVVFIDEIDSLLSQRSDTEHESSRRIKTEFLVQLDGASTSADDRLLVIGATNRPQEIDEAARRRLVKRLYIPLPDCPARSHIITNLMRQQPSSLTEKETEEISIRAEGYSGADMTNLCREAAYGPVREAAGSLKHISAEEMRPVNFVDFKAALQVVKPSVSEKDLDLYLDWNKQFGCGK